MTKTEYVACTMCGKTISRNKWQGGSFTIDPGDFRILQVREVVGGRSGQGFFNVPEEGKAIKELWDGDSEERAIAEAFKDRVLAVVRAYVRLGIISQNDLGSVLAQGNR